MTLSPELMDELAALRERVEELERFAEEATDWFKMHDDMHLEGVNL